MGYVNVWGALSVVPDTLKVFWFDILMNHVCEKDSYRTGEYRGWVPMYLGRWISLYMDSIISLMQVKKDKSQRDDSFSVAMICTNECLVCKPFECKVYGDLETICVMFEKFVVNLKPL